MTSKKNTNKALFSSVIALILCCSMLVGTTFAWFTDEVKSGVNQIVAGNLDVDVLVNGDSIQDKAVLFDEVKLWEPGVVAYENLTVVNKGNLALKYELSVNFDNATKTPAGKTLADVLQVGVVPGGVSGGRDEVVSKVTTWQPLKSFIEAGELLTQGAEKTYGIVIAWVPGANDNDYNMNNGQTTVLSVDLGVQLTAWQKDAEKDSFDETYDAVVHSETQLAEALQNGGKIKVGSDIEATKTLTVPAGVTATVYLNGKTLTGTTGRDADNNRVHVIKNEGTLTIVGGTVTSAGTNGGSAVANYGEMTIEDATLNGAPQAGSVWPSYTVNNYGVLTINNSTVVGAQGVIATNVDTAVTTVNNVVATRNGWGGSGHVFYTQAGELIVNGGIYTNNANGVDGMIFASGKGVTTYVNGGTFDINDGAYFALSKDTKLVVTAGDFTDIKSIVAWGGTMTVSGGTFAVDPSKYVAAGYTAANMGNGTWTVVKGEIAVSNADELAAAVAAGKTDIYLLDGEYDVYGCGGKTLTLTGSKNAVIKLHNDGEDGCDYAFGGNGTGVGDVTFNGVTIDTTANTGNYKGFAYMKGTYNDCNFVGAFSLNNANDYTFNRCTFDFKNGYFWTWGANSVTFDGCTFNGNSKAILAHGYASTVITIKDCTFAATEKGYTGSGDNTAAVEMDPAGTNTYTVKITGSTMTESYADWYRVKDGSTGHSVFVNGDDVINTIKIGTLAELLAFANDVNVNGNGYSGKTVVLTADIDLGNMEWAPVGQTGGNGVATYFRGRFDGKGHTISNLKITNNAYDEGKNYAAGFFGFVDAGDANIVNLTIDGANVNGHHWTGVIAGYLTGNISGCTVKNATVNCTHANGDACGDKAGVIVGYVNKGTVTGNTVEDCTVTAGRDAGQVAGCAKAEYVYGNTISNVTVSAAGGCTGANIRNEEIGRLN